MASATTSGVSSSPLRPTVLKRSLAALAASASGPLVVRVDFDNQIFVRRTRRRARWRSSRAADRAEPCTASFRRRRMFVTRLCPGEVLHLSGPRSDARRHEAVDRRAGVVHIVKNYTGGRDEFKRAAELPRTRTSRSSPSKTTTSPWRTASTQAGRRLSHHRAGGENRRAKAERALSPKWQRSSRKVTQRPVARRRVHGRPWLRLPDPYVRDRCPTNEFAWESTASPASREGSGPRGDRGRRWPKRASATLDASDRVERLAFVNCLASRRRSSSTLYTSSHSSQERGLTAPSLVGGTTSPAWDCGASIRALSWD